MHSCKNKRKMVFKNINAILGKLLILMKTRTKGYKIIDGGQLNVLGIITATMVGTLVRSTEVMQNWGQTTEVR